MTAALWNNWLTTLFGIMAGLPLIVSGSGISLPPKWNHYLLIVAGVGTVGLVVVAKAFNVHSDQGEVPAATIEKK